MLCVDESIWADTLKILEHIEIYFSKLIIKNVDKIKTYKRASIYIFYYTKWLCWVCAMLNIETTKQLFSDS